jgi:ribosomal protein S24E
LASNKAYVVIKKVKTTYNCKTFSKRKVYESKEQLKNYDGYRNYDDFAYDMSDDENDENQKT